MGELRTLRYILDDGQEVNTRQVADAIGISESAARNRLDKYTNPNKIFAPYNRLKGRRKKKVISKPSKKLPCEDDLWQLCMKAIGRKK